MDLIFNVKISIAFEKNIASTSMFESYYVTKINRVLISNSSKLIKSNVKLITFYSTTASLTKLCKTDSSL